MTSPKTAKNMSPKLNDMPGNLIICSTAWRAITCEDNNAFHHWPRVREIHMSQQKGPYIWKDPLYYDVIMNCHSRGDY